MMKLATTAEECADTTRDLPGFKEFSLPGMRDHVAELLSEIGRVEGIFRTYTKHDISHIDAMLKMLAWLVPSQTAEKMTPADWLLATLSIYLHDLGMLVTSEEFEKRNDNEVFRRWFDTLDKTNEGRDYLARTHRMNADEKERFFFQEYVRMGHASRIREWITGNHTRAWGPEVKPLAAEVHRLLQPLPVRFREYLGVVCESHHAEDLTKRAIFPLYAPCGGEVEEAVNVQYAAILLRTSDLLHVTKDRTPSIMLQAIKISDPKGVDEWDKQLGTFAVLPKKREFDPDDPDSTVIQVSANFREERPLFALQEYIAYANSQISQSGRWAAKSQEDSDAKNYVFPWRVVQGDVRLEGVPPHPLKFELDRGRLLDLLVGHTIYNDPTVAIRELLQNGIDAVRFQHHLNSREARAESEEPPEIGTVRVKWDPESRYVTVEDDGIGMDKDTIENHLMKVGLSYYNTPQFEADYRDFSPISRFGIGVLTCFMVSDDIEIVTCQGGARHRIRMTSVHADYLLRELPEHHELLDGIEPHGTRVRLRLRDTIDLEKKSPLEIVKHWVILPACKVEYVEAGKAVEQIGFESVEHAIRHFHKDSEGSQEQRGFWKTTLDFAVRERAESPEPGERAGVATYALAIALESQWRRERQFVNRSPESKAPAVCIEGIRVSDSLPWFSAGRSQSQISGLLAVSGDRRFRTTVSRSGLEVDEEYHRVGRICTELLFEHIHKECEAIANRQGRPLSQASSCSTWLCEKLASAADNARALDLIAAKQERLPSIVVEKVRPGIQAKVQTERLLITPLSLSDESQFWTIESRLVDSLGTISRDLGRELSLNEFLAALAPDVEMLAYSPLLPDAHLFSTAITKTHQPESVQFSRKNQQTAIRWRRQQEGGADIWHPKTPDSRRSDDMSGLVMRGLWEYHMGRYGYWRRVPFVAYAAIEGDDPDVNVVANRFGIVMRPDSPLRPIWSTVLKLMKVPNLPSYPNQTRFEIGRGVHQILDVLQGEGSSRNEWRNASRDIQTLMDEHGIDGDLPEDLGEFVESRWIFNASRYWIKWYD